MSTHGNIHSLAISQKALILGITTAITVVFYTVWPVRLLREYGSTLVIGWGMFIGGIMLMPFKILGTSGKMGLGYHNLSGNCSCIRNDCFF